ncbi:MAG: hypothetical protein A2498_01050 [Lentisphaerae bacterium RIFOXYC12_FULL_60_16]|nr:MAG: hypothetical protein A2498_01050 [Lentisphaerae bacterium RIFOXYC12_FULL_60_16]
MTAQRQRIVWGYVSEVVLAIIITGIALTLDHSGVLLRVDVQKWANSVHGILATHLLAGVFGFTVLPAIPFVLIGFAGEDMKRRILEHEGFGVYVLAYCITFAVVVCTYLLTPVLLTFGSTVGYAVSSFLWAYCFVLLLTAVKNAFVIIWLIQAMHRLERDIRAGMYK